MVLIEIELIEVGIDDIPALRATAATDGGLAWATMPRFFGWRMSSKCESDTGRTPIEEYRISVRLSVIEEAGRRAQFDGGG